MAGTRSSARLSSQQTSSPSQPSSSPKAAAGSKRKAELSASPTAKRGRKSAEKKEQKTIEDTMDVDKKPEGKPENQTPSHTEKPSQPEEPQEPKHAEATDREDASPSTGAKPSSSETSKKSDQEPATNGGAVDDKEETVDEPSKDSSAMDSTGKIEAKQDSSDQAKEDAEPSKNGETAVESHARDEETPASILEKGVIYFFFRGRTGIDNPSGVDDLARTYMVLRPLPHGAKLGDGPIGDADGKCRLLALPKKVLPLSGNDKFMTFVEKAKTSFKELKEDFMAASDYSTQTVGVRHTPPVTPLAEGVYAITTTGRESHLAYMITIPQELSEVQKDIGLREQGSFITSTKNPEYAGPANTNLPEGPGFPKEILAEFRGLRWAPLQPKFLDYENAQFLLIGESSGIEKAVQPQPEDQKDDKKADPKEELEKLEGEDEIRIKHLKGDDAVFTDLGISKKEYPQVPSTWDA